MTKPLDLVGITFGCLTVTARHPENTKGGNTRWCCRCACGNEIVAMGGNLVGGYSKSCGCVGNAKAAERARERNYKHGHAVRGAMSPEYVSWDSMWKRCTYDCVNGSEYYLGRGIAVCDRWQSFDLFLQDMGPRPSPDHSLDRYPNNDGNYEPDNCRWATWSEQALNRRKQAC